MLIPQFGLVSYTRHAKGGWAEIHLWGVTLKSSVVGLKCGEAITQGVYTRVPEDVVKAYCEMMQEQMGEEYPDFVQNSAGLELFICSATLD